MTSKSKRAKRTRNKIRQLRSKNMERIYNKSKRARLGLMRSTNRLRGGRSSRHMRSRHMRSRHMRSRHMRSRNRHTRKVSFGGNGLNLLPTPYHPIALVSGATNPQSSAMLAQKYANEQQNITNNALDGGGEEELDGLPVVQFSGQNTAKSNEQSVGLTNLLANMRAEGEGDADVTLRQ